jgi:hypothetical protein
MAMLQQFKVTVAGKQFTVEGLVYDDDRQLVGDYTGANIVRFPQVLNDLSDAQVQVLADMLGGWLLLTLSGLQP